MTPKEAYERATLYGYDEGLENIALKDPHIAYNFARYVPNANIEKLEDAVLKVPELCYWFAYMVPKSNINKLQGGVLSSPLHAYCFARDVKGVDIIKLQAAVLKSPKYSYKFAYIPGANIELLTKHMGSFLRSYHNSIIRDIIE